MFKRFWRSVILFWLAIAIVISVGSQQAIAQFPNFSAPAQEAPETEVIAPEVTTAPVVLAGETLFEIKTQIGVDTIPQRAANISEELQLFAASRYISLESLKIQPVQGSEEDLPSEYEIVAGDRLLIRITPSDGEAVGSTASQLSEEYLGIIQAKIRQYREERSFAHFAEGALKTAIATLILLLLLIVLRLIFPRLYLAVTSRRKKLPALRLGSRQIISGNRVAHFLGSLLVSVRLILTLSFLGAYFAFVLSLFPWTKIFGRSLWIYFSGTITLGWTSFISYLPNLFVLVMIYLLTTYSLRFIRPIFNEIGEERVKISGFYPEWAEPTYRLIEIFAFCLAAVLMFPYLPGFGSPAFQGVSLFVGLLVSLGSTAAVSNAVAGIILIYTRAFQIGDRIKVGDTFGDVEEKLLLVTRIRTFANTIVTIPNAVMIASDITNYSISMRDTNVPVGIKGVVTLGYDVPWRIVYQTLVNAALNTRGVLPSPAPIVLQTGLGDFSVTYELIASITDPQKIEIIQSELHQNMQDYCNQADIEILSPTYAAMRDGNHSTMPEDYLPEDYQTPGFNLHPIGNLFQVDLKMNNGKRARPSQ